MKKKWDINNLSLYNFDRQFDKDYEEIVACDEVGRGSLAGPIVVSCLILKKDFYNEKIKDSKLLSAKKREDLSILIKANSKYFFAYIDNKEIDKLNPLGATILATKECLKNFKTKNKIVLLDYLAKFHFDEEFLNIKKGDNKSLSIASASILAKIERDEYMRKISHNIQKYDFENNKGYGTQKHLAAIKKYGVSELHRLSYKPCK